MNEELNEILNQIRNAVDEMTKEFTSPIYDSRNGKNRLGNEAVYSKEIARGILLRLVNDGSYSIGGTATKAEKEAFLGKLNEILHSKDIPIETKDMVYPIVDALEESIKSPERDAGIKYVPLTSKPTPVVVPTVEPTPVVTPTSESTPVVTPTVEPTPVVTPTVEPTPVVTPTVEPTPVVTPTVEPTPVVTPTVEPTPVVTPTVEPTPVVVPTVEPIPVVTPVPGQIREKDLKLINDLLRNYEESKVVLQNIDVETLTRDGMDEIARKIRLLDSEIETYTKLTDDLNNKELSNDEYEDRLLGSLEQSRAFINSILLDGNHNIEFLDKKLMKSLDTQTDRMSERIEEIKRKKQEKNKPQTTDEPKKYEKEVLVQFDPKTGEYVLFEGDNDVLSIDAEKFYSDDNSVKQIYDRIEKATKEDRKDIEKYVDPAVYDLLSQYDKVHATNYSSKFVEAAIYGIGKDDDELPFELEYILARPSLSLRPDGLSENLSTKVYRKIRKYAKDYENEGIANIYRMEYEEPEQEEEEEEEQEDSNREESGSDKSLWQSLKDTGASALAALINLGHNIKDVFTGKKTFRQLIAAPFKSETSGDTKQIGDGKGESEGSSCKEPDIESRLSVNKRISSVVNNATKDIEDEEERKAVERQTLEKMANARGIDTKLKNGNPKPVATLRGEIRDYEAIRYENNKVGYVLPEEIGGINEPQKGKSGSKEPQKEPTGGHDEL